MDIFKSSNAVEADHYCFFIQARRVPQGVGQSIGAGPALQGELERAAR